MSRNRALILGLAALAAVASLGPSARAAGQRSLEEVQTRLAQSFPTVTQWSPEMLEARLADPLSLVVLDVREPQEHAVSRLAGARRVDPTARLDDVLAAAGGSVAGRDVLLYCSVGYRSATLAARLRKALLAQGARSVVNLQGGIFAWHNTGRRTVDAAGETVFIHPYDRHWSRYVEFNNLTRMGARPQ